MISLSEGTLFAQRYRIVRLIGQGGMGAVYEVVHLETERRRALKVMHPNIIESEEMRGRFRQEAKVAAHVDSEYIVDVFDAGIDDATRMPFLVMELLRGEELKKKLKAAGRFPPQDVVLYLYQASLALDKTHRANIIHRDLKPENLFLTHREDGRPHVKVLDFGVAKFVTDGGTQANSTRSLGTPLYMAPEQFMMTNTVSPQTDIYALGMIAYTLMVGVSYWSEEVKSGANIFAFAALMGAGPPEPPTQRAARRGAESLPALMHGSTGRRLGARATDLRAPPRPWSRWRTRSEVPHPSFEMPPSRRSGFPGPASAPTAAPLISGPSGAGLLGSVTPSPGMFSGSATPSPNTSSGQSFATGAAPGSKAGASKSSKGVVAVALAFFGTLAIGIGIVVSLSGGKGAGSTTATEAPAVSVTASPAASAMASAVSSVEPAGPAPSVIALDPAPANAASGDPSPGVSASASGASKGAKAPPGKGGSASKAPTSPKKDLFTRD